MPNVDRIIIATSLDRIMAPLHVGLRYLVKEKGGSFSKGGKDQRPRGIVYPILWHAKTQVKPIETSDDLVNLSNRSFQLFIGMQKSSDMDEGPSNLHYPVPSIEYVVPISNGLRDRSTSKYQLFLASLKEKNDKLLGHW